MPLPPRYDQFDLSDCCRSGRQRVCDALHGVFKVAFLTEDSQSKNEITPKLKVKGAAVIDRKYGKLIDELYRGA
jgi:hypothetical protein